MRRRLLLDMPFREIIVLSSLKNCFQFLMSRQYGGNGHVLTSFTGQRICQSTLKNGGGHSCSNLFRIVIITKAFNLLTLQTKQQNDEINCTLCPLYFPMCNAQHHVDFSYTVPFASSSGYVLNFIANGDVLLTCPSNC